jgi:hypothetical protein
MAFTYRYIGQVWVQQLLGHPVEYKHFFLENKDLEENSHGLISSTPCHMPGGLRKTMRKLG